VCVCLCVCVFVSRIDGYISACATVHVRAALIYISTSRKLSHKAKFLEDSFRTHISSVCVF